MQTYWEWYGGAGSVFVLGLVFTVGFVLAAMWVALPFALYGLKARLRELAAAQAETNRRLEEAQELLRAIRDRGAGRGSWDL